MHQLEIAQDSRTLNSDENWLRCELKWHCLVLSSLERTVAQLRSSIRFLKDGDANTALFHSQACFQKRKNFISKVVYDEGIATTQQDKHEAFFSYFEGLLGTAVTRSSTLDLEFFHREGLDLAAIDEPITEDEVWQTIRTLPADRALGPDGYTGRFYKS